MAKNRYIPFGYTMTGGRIVIEPTEASAVIRIFSEYINGMSLLAAARLMELENISYSSCSDHWNKNMIKRIIENEKYIGAMDYPQIIDEDTFNKANSQKAVRCTVVNDIPDEISEVRKRTYCAECGRRLIRKGGSGRYERWDCNNSDCSRLPYRLTDNMLIGAAVLALNTLIADPDILDKDTQASVYFPTPDVRRKENEISRMMDTIQADKAQLKDELFRLAQMRYSCCEYNNSIHRTAELKKAVCGREQLNDLDIDLFRACVSRIWVSHFYVIEIELINGFKLKNIAGRNDENENSR